VKILLVEDDLKIATGVRRGLESEGFTVEVAVDGDEGWWKATEGRFDLIVLDVMLPGRNGYQLCRQLREAGDWTPVLMPTAKSGDLDEAEALDTGADDFVTKPFSFVALVARIRALLRRSVGRDWHDLQRDLTTLSTDSRHRVVAGASHASLVTNDLHAGVVAHEVLSVVECLSQSVST
jgi:DNA-binding response OmpR family regulator